jgi:hypothetical protein
MRTRRQSMSAKRQKRDMQDYSLLTGYAYQGSEGA